MDGRKKGWNGWKERGIVGMSREKEEEMEWMKEVREK